MSEDTSAKRSDRRRRTTRAGRRRALRMPAGVAGEGWTPSWQRESEAEDLAPEEGHELGESDAEAGDLLEDGAETEEGGGAEDGFNADDDDGRPTEELHVSPQLAEALEAVSDEEKTQPRIRVDDAGLPTEEVLRDSEVDVLTDPKIKISAPPEAPFEEEHAPPRPSVVIAPARIILDSVPPPAPQPPVSETAAPVQVVTSPQPVASALPAGVLPQAEPAFEAFESVPAPAAGAEADLDEAGLQLEDDDDAEPDRARLPSRVPPPPPPTAARPEPAPPATTVAARAEPAPLPPMVQRNEPPLPAANRGKPPPPAAPRAEPAQAPAPAAKRPPPPPGPAKTDEDRQKRKQVRQWWERFFSDDYLMTVLPPSSAQIARQVDFIEASLGLSKGATILDVGCGLGLHSIELTKRGYLVVGLDLSLAMITRAAEAAQEQSLKINFVHADIREMEFDGAFDGVISLGTTFGFFDEEANRDVLARLLHALRPGGRLLLDVVNRDYVASLQPNLVWFEGDDCVCMEESDFNYFNSRLSVKRTMMREDGRQSNAEYSLRLYSLHELGQLMQQLGLRVIEVSGQEAIRGAFFGSQSPRILMLAERRVQARSSTSIPIERTSAEQGRSSVAFPSERSSAEVIKPPRSE